MPYAFPSPSTSPTRSFSTSPSRNETTRPLRHHMRAHSSDSLLPTVSSFIYVQPASPEEKPRASTSYLEDSTTPKGVPASANGRRIKIFGFTPATGDEDVGPSSQEESQPSEEDVVTPRASHVHSTSFSFGDSAPIPIPINIRPSHNKSMSTPDTHVKALKSSFPSRKTAMLRKKSGELVRSSLKTGESANREKPRSAPATPTCPKYVHFDTQLEHVKHFLSQQRPAAVSRSGSPVETETEDEPEAFPFPAMASTAPGTVSIRLPNFPRRPDPDQDVYLESLEITSDGKSLRGVTRVKNLAFEKWVAIRFTLDHWQTVSEVSAEHLETMGNNSDRFVFHIKLQDLLARIEEKTMFVAIRYTVGGREIWDNNGGGNYRVEFVKKSPTQGQQQQTIQLGTGVPKRQTWSVTNAGQAADRMADLRRELDRLVADDLDPSPLHASTRSFTEGSPSAFSHRYDFGNSLKMFAGTSSQRGQQPNGNGHANGGGFTNSSKPAEGSPSSPVKPSFTSVMVGGMPATVFHEPSPASSPVLARVELQPDFGAPSYKSSSPVTSAYGPQRTYNSIIQPQSNRPPSPPAENDLASLYRGYLSHPTPQPPARSSGSPFIPLQDSTTSRSRYNTYPNSETKSSQGSSLHYTPLLPPSFRDHRRKDSPFASPSMSPAMSPAMSPVPSPAMSPSGSPPRSSSPPLYPITQEDGSLWSPSSSIASMSSNDTNNHSPDSQATSVSNSPMSGFPPRPSNQREFSSFLDRYCFHTSSGPTPGHVYPHEVNDLSTTPRRSSSGTIPTSNCGAASYYASSGSSGSSTPSHQNVETPNGSLPTMVDFASKYQGPPAIVS